MERVTMTISGMTCGHCVAGVTRALEAVDGAAVERVQIGSATVAYDPAATSPAHLARAVVDAGYDARPAADAGRSTA